MKSLFRLYVVAVSAIIVSSGSPLHAATYHSFLRVNKLYILYTDPIVPHADNQGNFWVGFTPIAMLLGAKYTEENNGLATVKYENQSLTFSPGKNAALLDGRPFRLSVPAKRIGRQNRMVIPLQSLAAAFGLHSHWDKRYHVLTLTDTNLIDKGAAAEFAGFIEKWEGPPSGFVAQSKIFKGPPYPIAPIVPVAVIQNGTHLVFCLRNVSAKGFPHVDVNELQIGQRGEELVQTGIPFFTTYPNPLHTYSLERKTTFDYKMSIANGFTNDPHDIDPANPGIVAVVKHLHKVSFAVVWIVL